MTSPRTRSEQQSWEESQSCSERVRLGALISSPHYTTQGAWPRTDTVNGQAK